MENRIMKIRLLLELDLGETIGLDTLLFRYEKSTNTYYVVEEDYGSNADFISVKCDTSSLDELIDKLFKYWDNLIRVSKIGKGYVKWK
jgi:hypothetical protein